MKRCSLLILLCTLMLAGCGGGRAIRSESVQYGFLENKNVEIVAADGSFTLKPGAQFDVPFQVDLFVNEVAKHGVSDVYCGRRVPLPFLCDRADLLDPRVLRAAGARDVRVKVLGTKVELYGLLMFNRPFDRATMERDSWLLDFYPSAMRSYAVRIPEDVISRAMAGQTTVAYEGFARYKSTAQPEWVRGNTLKSWSLTLSRVPL